MADRAQHGGASLPSRRAVLAAGPATLLASATGTRSAIASSFDAGFVFPGIFLDAAFTHPFGRVAREAALAHAELRARVATQFWPVDNPRDAAVQQFAQLINAEPQDVAVVPSTLEGENLVGQALGLGRDAGVVTDALHYDASLVLYAEARRQGTPVEIVRPRGLSIDLDDIGRAITPRTRLIAVSLVSSVTGFCHDLTALCALAHSRGVLVYADIIQAAGAMPIDVRASGVDFCCAGTYKWLMGDFGTAFLYVRPDRLTMLRRVQIGWRQVVEGPTEHFLPGQSAGDVPGAYSLRDGAAGLFEVSSPSYGALAVAAATIGHINSLGVERIAARRRPMMERLQAALPRLGLHPLTPSGSSGPVIAFGCRNASRRLRAPLAGAGVKVSLYDDRIRISPSVYNGMADVDRLIEVLEGASGG